MLQRYKNNLYPYTLYMLIINNPQRPGHKKTQVFIQQLADL